MLRLNVYKWWILYIDKYKVQNRKRINIRKVIIAPIGRFFSQLINYMTVELSSRNTCRHRLRHSLQRNSSWTPLQWRDHQRQHPPRSVPKIDSKSAPLFVHHWKIMQKHWLQYKMREYTKYSIPKIVWDSILTHKWRTVGQF